jgi:hypothetical protein
MKKFLLTATLLVVAAPFAAPAALAQAQTQQAPDGYSVLSAIYKAKGLVLTPAQIRDIMANTKPSQLAALSKLLGMTPSSLADVVAAGNSPVAPAVALRAVLEAATGKPVSLAAVQQLVRENPGAAQAVANLSRLAELVNNPVAATRLANTAEAIANRPVTPRGGGN